MSDKITVTFVQDCVVDDHRKGTADQEAYAKGKSYELSEASANRWVRRGKAVFGKVSAAQLQAAARSADDETPKAKKTGAKKAPAKKAAAKKAAAKKAAATA